MSLNNIPHLFRLPCIYLQRKINTKKLQCSNFIPVTMMMMMMMNRLYFGSRLTYWKKTVFDDFWYSEWLTHKQWWTRSHSGCNTISEGQPPSFPPKAVSELFSEMFMDFSVSDKMLETLVFTQLLTQVCLMKEVWQKCKREHFLKNSGKANRSQHPGAVPGTGSLHPWLWEMWPDFFPSRVHSRSSLNSQKRKGANPMEGQTKTTLDASF